MDDLEIAKAIVSRLSREQISQLTLHIASLTANPQNSPPPIPPPKLTTGHTAHRLTIEFCESTAGSFGQVLSAAKAAPHYTARDEHKKTWHSASWPELNFPECLPLVSALSSLRNKRCIIDGSERDWTEVFGFANCAADRSRSYRPTHYCFGKDGRSINPWGCIHARMEWSEWARWFTYGRFEKAGFLGGSRLIWIFDKGRIRHELENSIFSVRYCPHLNTELIAAVLNTLPDKLDVEKSSDWKFHESFEAAPGRPKIVKKERSEDFTFTNEFYADGVCPVGLDAFRDLLRKSFRQANMPDTLLLELLD